MTHGIPSPARVISTATYMAFRYAVPEPCPNVALTSAKEHVTNGNNNERA